MGRMNPRALVLLLFLALAPAAWAQEQAFTNRSTELKERGANDARTVATLPENTAVKVLARAGGWTRVDAGGQNGWVRVFHLRFPTTVDSSSKASSGGGGGFLSGVTSMLGGGRQTSQPTTIATTGIRGLSPEDMKNASPDAAALAKAQSYRADKPAAERFAREGKLTAVSVDYSQGERR
jgi:SH3 domain-containing protein